MPGEVLIVREVPAPVSWPAVLGSLLLAGALVYGVWRYRGAVMGEHDVQQVAREAIKTAHKRNIDDLPYPVKVRVWTAVLDAQKRGPKAMWKAALKEYRYQMQLQAYKAPEDDDED